MICGKPFPRLRLPPVSTPPTTSSRERERDGSTLAVRQHRPTHKDTIDIAALQRAWRWTTTRIPHLRKDGQPCL